LGVDGHRTLVAVLDGDRPSMVLEKLNEKGKVNMCKPSAECVLKDMSG